MTPSPSGQPSTPQLPGTTQGSGVPHASAHAPPPTASPPTTCPDPPIGHQLQAHIPQASTSGFCLPEASWGPVLRSPKPPGATLPK